MTRLLRGTATILACATVCGAFAQDAPFTREEEAELFAICRREMQDKRLDPIRGKIPLYWGAPTADGLSLDRKPAPAEGVALRLWFDYLAECNLRLAQFNARRSNTEQFPASVLDLPEGALRDQGRLSLLILGKVTYAQYNQKLKAERDALLAARNWLFLSCIADTPAELRGIETQYKINLAESVAYASRGAGQPKNVRIDDTQVWFEQGDMIVSISRATGNYSVTSNSLAVSGRCERITSVRF